MHWMEHVASLTLPPFLLCVPVWTLSLPRDLNPGELHSSLGPAVLGHLPKAQSLQLKVVPASVNWGFLPTREPA